MISHNPFTYQPSHFLLNFLKVLLFNFGGPYQSYSWSLIHLQFSITEVKLYEKYLNTCLKSIKPCVRISGFLQCEPWRTAARWRSSSVCLVHTPDTSETTLAHLKSLIVSNQQNTQRGVFPPSMHVWKFRSTLQLEPRNPSGSTCFNLEQQRGGSAL